MKLFFFALTLLFGLGGLGAAFAEEQPAQLVSEWTLTGANLPPGWAPNTFDCPKGLRVIDGQGRIQLQNSDPDANAPAPLVPVFTDINQPAMCMPVAPDSTVRACTQTTRPLNGDVWALTQISCKTEQPVACKTPDLRWTVTARPDQLVLRRDCRNCPMAVMTGQCIYAFVKGAIRHGDGPRVGSEHEHHHHDGDPDDDHDMHGPGH
jgi:hypothetical protein